MDIFHDAAFARPYQTLDAEMKCLKACGLGVYRTPLLSPRRILIKSIGRPTVQALTAKENMPTVNFSGCSNVLASFPDLPTVHFLIACSMKKQRGKAWYHLSRE